MENSPVTGLSWEEASRALSAGLTAFKGTSKIKQLDTDRNIGDIDFEDETLSVRYPSAGFITKGSTPPLFLPERKKKVKSKIPSNLEINNKLFGDLSI